MDKLQTFILSVFTENRPGLLGRITIILTRRRLNIENINVSESEVTGVHRYTLSIRTTKERADKTTAQIGKLVDVLKAFVHAESEVITLELALYKLGVTPINRPAVEQVVRQHRARLLDVNPEFMVVEKTGQRKETEELRMALETYGVLEFSRSGQVTVTRPMKALRSYLAEMDAATA
jgi:acetolactate synthase-1/3 small subunit